MNLRSVTTQAVDSLGDLISAIDLTHLFRKLLLYPAELRGRSAPVIFYLAAGLPLFSTIAHYISRDLTTFDETPPGKHREFLVMGMASGGNQWQQEYGSK